MKAIDAWGYFFCEPKKPLEKKSFKIETIKNDEVVIKVAGCGLCHTDISFYLGHVKTKQETPIVLGHEISGQVIEAGDKFANLIGKNVIIPAVLPCGECDLCKAGRDNICQSQKMPGNDFNGGFASHLVVPGRSLCVLPEDIGDFNVSQLSVIADAVTTPYQSLIRSKLVDGDLAIVIGVGGIGIYMLQLAKAKGAKVIAIDIDDEKLEIAKKAGSDFIINSKDLSERDVKKQIRGLVKEHALPANRWKVFETSGTGPGQSVAFSLLSYAGTIGIIGFTMDKANIRLSNIMAFDADVFGNWGCSPDHYPPVVKQILSHQIDLKSHIQAEKLDDINKLIALALDHKLIKRVIFTP